jgi:hypothetical protein
MKPLNFFNRSAFGALVKHIKESLSQGPKTRKQLIEAGKAQEFTPSDVRSCIDHLCRVGTATHDRNEKGVIIVRLTLEGEIK